MEKNNPNKPFPQLTNRKRLRIKIPKNRRSVAGVKNVPSTIAHLAQQYCESLDQDKIDQFNVVMKFEDVCGPTVGSLWDDNNSPLGTVDDMTMAYLCNLPIDITDDNGNVIESTTMVKMVAKYYPWQKKWLDCALNPPNGDPQNCCGQQEPVWNN